MMTKTSQHRVLAAVACVAGLLCATPALGQHPGSTTTHTSHIANENVDCASVPPWAPHPPGCDGHGSGGGGTGTVPDRHEPPPPLPSRPPRPILPGTATPRPSVPPSIGWLFPRWFLLVERPVLIPWIE
ncbi:MAG: hypothetical protein KJO43_11160 [Phycisphaerae bacterium]|nr:hypothetical protein [Phycisphaerae bacterium]